jgi:hypothetical protein
VFVGVRVTAMAGEDVGFSSVDAVISEEVLHRLVDVPAPWAVDLQICRADISGSCTPVPMRDDVYYVKLRR